MISLNQTVLEELVGVVEPSSDECCGFLLGYENDGQRIVTTVMSVPNSAPKNRFRNFRIAAKDYLQAESFADQFNLRLLGVYHSHPNCPAIPSEYDRIAAQPYFSYLILSVMNKKFNDMRSWNLNSNFQFEEEILSIEN
jgi:proteasome lid subunit RPN8/RPN11